MISELTWSQYLVGTGALLILYYLGVAGWYYRQEVKHLLMRKPAVPESTSPPEEEEHDFLSYDALKEVASQIRQGILEEAGNHAGKQALLMRLKAILASCGGLRQPASRGAINQYIIQQAESLCGIRFTEEELEQEWNTLGDT